MNRKVDSKLFVDYFFERIKDDLEYRKSYNYLLGIYLGDGNINVSQMRLSCSKSHPKIIIDIKRAINNVFDNVHIGEYCCGEKEMLSIAFSHKDINIIFPQSGLGPKYSRDVSLAPWQKENIEHKELALGLFHSDGSYYNSKTTSIYGKVYNRYFYSFTNVSQDINEIYKECLDSLGIEYKFYLKTPREKTINGRSIISKNIYHTVIQKKKEVDKAYKLFGYKS